jgi:hypothetical protein
MSASMPDKQFAWVLIMQGRMSGKPTRLIAADRTTDCEYLPNRRELLARLPTVALGSAAAAALATSAAADGAVTNTLEATDAPARRGLACAG